MAGTPPYSPTTEAVFAALKMDYVSGLDQLPPIQQFLTQLKLGALSIPGQTLPMTMRWQGIYTAFLNGTLWRNAKHGLMGNSTIAGEIVGGGNTQGLVCPAQQLADIYIANGINASANNLFGSQGCNDPADLRAKDLRYGFEGAVAFGSVPCMGGQGLTFSGSGSHYWRPHKPVSFIEIDWRNSTNTARSFGLSVNGGAEQIITCTGINAFARNTLQLNTNKPEIATIRLRQIGADPMIFSVKAWDNTNGRKEITV